MKMASIVLTKPSNADDLKSFIKFKNIYIYIYKIETSKVVLLDI